MDKISFHFIFRFPPYFVLVDYFLLNISAGKVYFSCGIAKYQFLGLLFITIFCYKLGDNSVGGFVGLNSGGLIENSTGLTGSVTGVDRVGGIVGENLPGSIRAGRIKGYFIHFEF